MFTNGLKEIDNTSQSIARHKMASAVDDELSTPDDVFYDQTNHYDIVCDLDPFTTTWIENGVLKSNSKCIESFTINENALEVEWLLPDGSKPSGVWINHPHSLHKETLSKALEQWQRHDLDMIMIIPANTVRPPYWSVLVQPYLNKGLIVEPLVDRKYGTTKGGYINFKRRGEDSEYDSRNGYLVIRYFSKQSWTRFLKKRIKLMKSYGSKSKIRED